MCSEPSPSGRLSCANLVCNGRSHVWVHESSAPDRKRDLDTRNDAGTGAGFASDPVGDQGAALASWLTRTIEPPLLHNT
jgi:hypothetical protein